MKPRDNFWMSSLRFPMLMKSVSSLCLELFAFKALQGESLYHHNQQIGNISLIDFFFYPVHPEGSCRSPRPRWWTIRKKAKYQMTKTTAKENLGITSQVLSQLRKQENQFLWRLSSDGWQVFTKAYEKLNQKEVLREVSYSCFLEELTLESRGMFTPLTPLSRPGIINHTCRFIFLI